MPRTRIASTGIYAPENVVTNADLEKIMDTSDEWIQQRSGIKERRWIKEGDGNTTHSMAHEASKQALENGGFKADDIDAIIFGALVTDFVFPGTGVLLQESLGFSKHVPALDIRNQCSGFVYALSIADAWIRSGMYKRILIVSSEIHSTSIQKNTAGRDVTVLFGDAAGATIVEATEDENYVIDSILYSQGQHAKSLCLAKPSANDHPRTPFNNEDPEIWPNMDGRLVFKNAVTRMTEVAGEILKKNGLSTQDLDFVIPHQANLRINQMVLQQLEISPEKTHNTLDRYGNTTMVTIPLTLHEAIEQNKLKRGNLLAFLAFGSGFTWGANILRF